MIIYYAAGGGLGHLTRARAVIHTLGISDHVALLTASPFASDKRVVGDIKVIQIPQDFATDLQSYNVWLQEIFAAHKPSEFYLDTFPAGIFGEFCDFAFPRQTKLFHLARLLQWNKYSKQIDGVMQNFAATFLLEPLEEAHEIYLQNHSGEIFSLALEDPPHDLDDDLKKAAIAIVRSSVAELLVRHPQSSNQTPIVRRPLWLIVHSGSSEEIQELVNYAVEMSRLEKISPRLVLLTPLQNAASQSQSSSAQFQPASAGFLIADSKGQTPLEHFDFYPAAALFPIADRIITACGFNAMRHTEKYASKHRFMPFARRFDNQFLRAARRKEQARLEK